MPILDFKFFGSLLLISFFFLHSCAPASKVPPRAVKGVLDLRDWEFDQDGITNLDGEWEFYNNGNQLQSEGYIVSVPSSKDEILMKGKRTEVIGKYTYKLKILMNQESKTLSIRPGIINTSYILHWNNQIIGSAGAIANEVSNCTPSFKPGIYDILFISEVNELKIEICNIDINNGGVLQSIRFGNKEILNKSRELNIGIESIIAGGIFLIGLYYLGLYNARRTEYSHLYFGLFCLSIFVFSIVNGQLFIYNVYPNLKYIHKMRIDYCSTVVACLFIVLFISNLFKLDQIRFIKKTYIITSTLIIFLMIYIDIINLKDVFDIILINVIVCFTYILIVIAKAIKNKRPESINFLLVILILIVFAMNDFLNEYGYLKTGLYFPYGLFIVIFIQSYILTKRFSDAFLFIENLSHNLQLSNQELEITKERATQAYLDLEASQKQLVQSDKMITLGTMVAGVAHEINTPLGAIKANSENILESLETLIQKINPILSHISSEDLERAIFVLELSKESNTGISSREARAIRKKVISTLEEKGKVNIEIMSDHIVEMGLADALDKGDAIFDHPDLEKYLSIANDLYGIRKKSSVIQISAVRVSRIVKSLKSFMHFDQNEKMIVSDLTEGMETVLIILHNKIKYGIEVVKNYGENVPQIPCYPDELNQVWTNLIHNAIQAMSEKGTLLIDIENLSTLEGTPDIDKRNPDYKGGYVAVSIQDSGMGVPPEIRSKIFQAFFTTKSAGEGSGLGLHIIGKILEKHAGALYLESEPGKTRFTVILPILPENI